MTPNLKGSKLYKKQEKIRRRVYRKVRHCGSGWEARKAFLARRDTRNGKDVY